MNWQGRSFTIDLGPLTAILGGNMEGKSSVPHAMRVGLTGYSPAHGKQAGACFGFIGNENGAVKGGVELAFDDGVSVNRLTWEMRRGKIEAGEKKMDVKVPPVMLDLGEEFFRLSGPKRTDFIFGRMDMTKLGFSVEEITARIKKDVKVAEPSAESEQALADIVGDIEELDRERSEVQTSYQEFIAWIVAKIAARADSAKTTLDQMAGLIQGTTVLQGSAPVLAPFDPDDLAKARQAHADLVARKNNAAKYEETVRKHTAHRAAYVKALNSVKDHSPEITRIEAEVAALDKEIAKFQSRTKGAALALEKARTAKAEADAILERRQEEIDERKAELAKDQAAKCCPKCKSKGAAWTKLLKAEAKEIEAEEKKLAADSKEAKKLVDAIEDLEKTVGDTEAEDRAHEQRRQDRQAKNKTANELKLAGTAVKVELPTGPIVTSQTLTAEACRERVKSIDEQLTAPPVDPSPADIKIEEARQEVERLESLQRSHAGKQADELRAEEGRAKHATAAAEREVATQAAKVMQALKAEMMDKAFQGFVDKVNQFCGGLFKYSPKGIAWRDGEIGYLRGATWVSLDYFCGTEKMLTYIGLSVALAEESPCRIVFVDEWLRDANMRRLVAKRLKDLVDADVIDQAIVIDTEADGYVANMFKIVEVAA